ncbi:MAG: amino acid adenylation domain-containing protein, partial [Candidatus Azotimanducaceae bacterium]
MSEPSLAQQRLWFLDQLNPDGNAYNVANVIRLTGSVTDNAIRGAVAAIVERHEPLRSHFATVAGQPKIQVAEAINIVVDSEVIPGEGTEQLTVAMERARQFALAPITLNEAPLARWKILRLSHHEQLLVYAVHHTISDRWSLGLFVKELISFLQGSTPTPLTTRYQEYSDNQRQQFENGLGEQSLTYFESLIGPGPHDIKLPMRGSRPAQRRELGAKIPVDLSALLPGIRKLAKATRATPYIITMTAFQAWLGHITGSWSPILTTYSAGRIDKSHDALIGLFVNSLALRFELIDNPTFEDSVVRTRNTWRNTSPHVNLPFELLVDRIAPQRDLSRTPIAQVAFNFHNTPIATESNATLSAEILEIDLGSSRYDLTLTLRPTRDSLTGELEYDTDLFDRETARRFTEQYQHLLSDALSQPTKSVRALAVTPAEQHTSPISGTVCASDFEETLQTRIARHYRSNPDNPAVTCNGRTYSYLQLQDAVTWLVTFYREQSIGPDDCVGLLINRTEQIVINVLALFELGAAYLPLDPAHPSSRLSTIVADAGVNKIITDQAHLPFQFGGTILNPSAAEVLQNPNSDAPSSTSFPEKMAYMIYTSGSTGQPKGVKVSHDNMTALWHSLDIRINAPDRFRFLSATTISFDISVLELFWPLWRGAELVIADEQTTKDGYLLAQEVSEVDFFQATPSGMRMLIDAGFQPSARHTLLCGGEPLPLKLAQALRANGSTVHNMYGPTEATVWSSSWPVSTNSEEILLGEALPGEWFYIMNDEGQPVPLGCAGELWIGGAGVALGYHNRESLDQDRFVADPFHSQFRCYRTGDTVRLTGNEALSFVGRLDGQIKLRGHRIEPAEIETCLENLASINTAIVKVFGQDDRARLVAFYTIESDGGAPTSTDLAKLVESILPASMRPSRYVEVAEFAVSVSGKINRHALLEPKSHPTSKRTYTNNDIELRVQKLWSDLLEIPPPDRKDDFFSLGGNSLLAVRMLYDVQVEFGIQVSLAS